MAYKPSTTAKQEKWERTVGKAIVELHEECHRRNMSEKDFQEYLRRREGDNDPILNLRRKLKAQGLL
jgi:hypothetical protein